MRQNLGDIALNCYVRLLDFTEFRAIDIDMNNFGVRAELRGFTNRPVIKTCTENNQQIRLLQNIVSAARAVHPQHAQRQRMRFW
ncbi:hypothetical protein D3C72_1896090 [compost metagenome]